MKEQVSEPSPEAPIKEGKQCPFCKKDKIKNLGSHIRFCRLNPDADPNPNFHPKKKEKETDPEQPVLQENIIQPVPTEEERPHEKINISDVQAFKQPDIYNTNQLVAWFGDETTRIFKVPEFIGIVHLENGDAIPSVLIVTPIGTILPAYFLPDFIGMFPQNKNWGETKPPFDTNNDDTEPFPPYPVEEEIPALTQTDSLNKMAWYKDPPKEKKLTLLSRIKAGFKRNPKKEPVSFSTKELLKDTINATIK